MTCLYCELVVQEDEPSERRGTWTVHRACQLRGERRGVYLMPNGDLVVEADRGGIQELRRLRNAVERCMEASNG